MIGQRKFFAYPNYGTPDVYPYLTERSEQWVTVLEKVDDAYMDPNSERMWTIRFSDGLECHAYDSELFDSEVTYDPEVLE